MSQTLKSFCSPFSCVVVVTAAMFCSPIWAADDALIEGEKITITVQDMHADALRMPAEMRPQVFAKPQTVTQIASNLYARRAMALRAEADGVDKDPAVAAALRIARDKVLSDALMEKMDKAATPSDEAAEKMARTIYKAKPDRFKADEQVRIRHILISATTPGAREKIDQVLKQLSSGAEFSNLAKELSADPGSAAKGGDLGFFTKGRMVPEFEAAAFALKKQGDVSGIVETKFGFHVLQLEEKRPAGIRPFEEVREELLKEVKNSVVQEARVAEAQKLQQNAKINTSAIANFSSEFSKASVQK
jgi:peptidyl-prolyl cis-trans isomerase C